MRRNYRAGLLEGPSAPPPRSSPMPLRWASVALRTPAPHTHPLPAPAMPSGPVSHSASAAATPGVHTPPAPCTPEASPSDVSVASQLLDHPYCLCSCNTPPAACLQAYPPAPLPPLRAPQPALPASPRSLPTRSGTPGSSPENHCAPKTLSSRPAATDLNPLFYTSALVRLRQTDPPRTAPPSVPPDSNTLSQPLCLRYTVPPS